MAQVSRRLRHARKLKRQNTLLFRALTRCMSERDFYKGALEQLSENAKKAKSNKVEITRVADDPDAEPTEILEGGPIEESPTIGTDTPSIIMEGSCPAPSDS